MARKSRYNRKSAQATNGSRNELMQAKMALVAARERNEPEAFSTILGIYPSYVPELTEFDAALFGHIGFAISNAVRSLVMAFTLARFERAPYQGATRRYYQHVVRFSSSFAFAVDVAMLTLGGYLKKKESLSARLGDVLSSLYLASMVLKHYNDEDQPPDGQRPEITARETG